MKTISRYVQTLLILSAVAAMPHLASAAKVFTTTGSGTFPASTNIMAAFATNLTAIVSVADGSGGTAVTTGSHCTNIVTVFTNGVVDNSDLTASVDITSFNAISPGVKNMTLTVTTTALTLSNTYIVSIVTASNPPNSILITPFTNTYTITMASSFVPPATPVMVWTPPGADTNWGTSGNWTPTGPPKSTNDVFFYDAGAVTPAGTINNVVTNSLTIGSLTYGQTNNSHTTLIASGKTLTVVGTNGLAVGTGKDQGSVQIPTDTISGAGGALVVSNLSANVNVSQASPSSSPSTSDATLDMSGLDVFNATISRMLVGVDSVLKGANGVLNLARTNIITMTPGSASPQIDVGEGSQSSAVSATGLNTLLLGQTNACFVDSIAVGRGRADNGIMQFNSAFSSPTAYFRGTNGNASRVGTWTIGDGFNGKLNSCHATNDFSLGTVNALVDTMNVGVGANVINTSKPTPGKGVLSVNAGIIDVNNLNVGVTLATNQPDNNPGSGNGTVNLTGGALVVNNSLTLASTVVAGVGSGTLNISSATVTANNGITVGGSGGSGTASISLTSSTLNVTNSTAGIGTSNTPLSSFAITNSTLNLAIQSGAPSIATTNLAVGSGPNTINVISPALMTSLPSQFQVIQYGVNGGSASGNLSTFVLGSLPSASPAYGAYISNNVANNSIDIVFTNGPVTPILTWDGTNDGNWNTSTANWKPVSGTDTVYVDTAFVTFDDTLRGTTSVSLTGTLLPGTLSVNNTLSNYVFGGTGKISGTVEFVKNGSGSLVLDNSGANDFSGGVTINSGTLQIGNNDANGNIPSDPLTDNGALIFKRSDANLTMANIITGSGTLTQNGTTADILTLTATNTSYTGAIMVLSGTLQAGSPKAFGTNQSTGSITVTNAGTLDVNFQKFGIGAALPVTVSGGGVGGNGAIVNNNSNQTSVLHYVTMAADTTIGGSGNWDIRTSGNSVTNNDAQLNGAFNLTKVGSNTVTLTSVQMDPGLGNINVQAGTLDVANMTTSLGNPGATATVFTNATLVLDSLSNMMSKVVVLNDGGTLKGSSTNYSGGPVTFGGPVTLLGAGTFTANSGALLLLTNAVSGVGGLTKSGSGVVFLGASNTYSGNTIVSGGTLALTNYNSIDGSINASTNINITSGATIDVSGRSNGTLTLKSGQTLVGGVVSTNGPGMIRGSLTNGVGATVAPGTGATNVGVLSVTGNATLLGSTVMKISATGGNDQILSAGITYGGSLVVTNCSGTLTNGQTFQLFVATNGNYSAGTFSGGVTLPSAAGLTWTNNLTVNGTITAGVVSGPSPIPVITNIGLLGTNLHLNGTNGAPSGSLYVLASTNMALPLTNWTFISTNTFTGSGTFNVTVTNALNPNTPQSFYLIMQPH